MQKMFLVKTTNNRIIKPKQAQQQWSQQSSQQAQQQGSQQAQQQAQQKASQQAQQKASQQAQQKASQQAQQKAEYVYDGVVLRYIDRINISRTMNLLNRGTFYSSNACIISKEDENDEVNKYVLSLRWINFAFEEGSYYHEAQMIRKFNKKTPDTSLYSTLILDGSFNLVNESHNINVWNQNTNHVYLGIEDIRIFKHNNEYFYTGVAYNQDLKTMKISADKLDTVTGKCNLNPRFIASPFSLNQEKIEKNWVYVNYNGELCVVYSWLPLVIGKCNFGQKKLNVIKMDFNLPSSFYDSRGSSSGCLFNNEIWFVLHKKYNDNRYYQHFIAIFDKDMNLLRYSEEFKFVGRPVEFCMGLIVEESRVIMSYTELDTNSFIATYGHKYLLNELNWSYQVIDEKSIIPKNIYQTWHTLKLPFHMQQNVDKLKRQNPDFTHYLFDDAMCRIFIKENFADDVLFAFDKLKPGAYKADLWRYCILFINGGIYLDIKYSCVEPFKLRYLTFKEHWVCERGCLKEIGVHQALLVTFPRNDILQNCITDIVRNVKENYFGTYNLCVTGPTLLGRYFDASFLNKNALKFDENMTYYNIPVFEKYKEYVTNEQHSGPIRHYSHLWGERNIYNYTRLNIKMNIDEEVNKYFVDKSKEITLVLPKESFYKDVIKCAHFRYVNNANDSAIEIWNVLYKPTADFPPFDSVLHKVPLYFFGIFDVAGNLVKRSEFFLIVNNNVIQQCKGLYKDDNQIILQFTNNFTGVLQNTCIDELKWWVR